MSRFVFNKIKCLKLFFTGVLLFIIFSFLYLNFAWLLICSPEEMKHNAAIINSSEPLPEKFLIVYDSLYPNNRHNSMLDQLSLQILQEFLMFRKKRRDCKCDEIGYFSWNNDSFDFKGNHSRLIYMYPEYGFGLERLTTPEQCFDFLYQHNIYYRGRYLKDLNEFSKIKFGKNIDSLKYEEIIKLIQYRRRSNFSFNTLISFFNY